MFLVQIYPDSGMWEILVYQGDEITLIQIFSYILNKPVIEMPRVGGIRGNCTNSPLRASLCMN